MMISYAQVMPNQYPMALLAPPDCPSPPSWVYLIKYSAMKRKGYPRPSFAPDSAVMILCSFLGMFWSANLPFTIEAERTGSVGVTHDPTARAYTNGMLGTRAHNIRAVLIHITHIPGTKRYVRLLHSVFKYRWGSCMPARTSWTPRTRRVK